MDPNCGLPTRDGHRGIDFAWGVYDSVNSGIAMLTSASGIVEAVRGGVPDTFPATGFEGDQQCGNAVRLGRSRP
ncbi:hypothetical protein [Tropicibacter sp. S64]|uniref:hypothetical protein n=1 Tax=Tropicibacter sp. S64 TaxID=3415122 RepID=UPI003C7D025C